MASIGEVATALRAVLAMVEEAATSAKAADDRIENVLGSLEPDLADSSSSLWHVEGDVAAKVRADGLDGAAFYLNIPLCGARPEKIGEAPA